MRHTFLFFVTLWVLMGCGRTTLDDDLIVVVDASADARNDAPLDARTDADASSDTPSSCGPTTCPTGCCDESGRCRVGSEPVACGLGGLSCADCNALGFQRCDPARKQCVSDVPRCGPGSCSGCCDGSQCVLGTAPASCGRGGAQCLNCSIRGLSCSAGQCVASRCGPENCGGCCLGEVCLSGLSANDCGFRGAQCQMCPFGSNCLPTPVGGGTCTPVEPTCGPGNCAGCCTPEGICDLGKSNTSCGLAGARCDNCLEVGAVCVSDLGSPGGKCSPVPRCGPGNCAGCCQGDACVPGGALDNACGFGGLACDNCFARGEVCSGGKCAPLNPTCGPGTCPGCCDAGGQCQPGFVDFECGQGGAACADCASSGTACNTAASPRTCTTTPNQCPSAYPGCPQGTTMPSPSVQHVCGFSDLANAASACSQGAHTPSCQAFLAFQAQVRPACHACLSPFAFDFQEFLGIFACVSPHVSLNCNRNMGCANDCIQDVCLGCQDDPARVQCRSDAVAGVCVGELQNLQCVGRALFRGASFCNPSNYGGSYGAWLEGVGAHYCGP